MSVQAESGSVFQHVRDSQQLGHNYKKVRIRVCRMKKYFVNTKLLTNGDEKKKATHI